MKYLTLSLLLVASSAAQAEWIKVTSDGIRTVYVDYSTLKIQGNFRKIWSLMDSSIYMAEMQGFSTKNYLTFDCENDEYQMNYGQSYQGPMGKGEPMQQYKGNGFELSIPDSLSANVLKVVCSHKK